MKFRKWRVIFIDERGTFHVSDFWTYKGANKYRLNFIAYLVQRYRATGNKWVPNEYRTTPFLLVEIRYFSRSGEWLYIKTEGSANYLNDLLGIAI